MEISPPSCHSLSLLSQPSRRSFIRAKILPQHRPTKACQVPSLPSFPNQYFVLVKQISSMPVVFPIAFRKVVAFWRQLAAYFVLRNGQGVG